jgi:hypothetical protein
MCGCIYNCDFIMKVLQVLLTFVIGVFAAIIAWQQWRTSHHKLRLDLFDKRIAVFNDLMEFINSIVQQGTTPQNAWIYLHRKANERKFLFGEDIQKYGEELRQNAHRLALVKIEIDKTKPLSEERHKLTSEEADINKWFIKQMMGGCADAFSHYFKFAQKT